MYAVHLPLSEPMQCQWDQITNDVAKQPITSLHKKRMYAMQQHKRRISSQQKKPCTESFLSEHAFTPTHMPVSQLEVNTYVYLID